MVAEDQEAQLRAKALRLRKLADAATDPEVAAELRQLAAELESAVSILRDR